MAASNERVFQLSLTEIAFVISFILLLLLGYLVSREQAKAAAAEAALVKLEHLEAAAVTLDSAKVQLGKRLSDGGVKNADEVISKLLEVGEVGQERDRLKQRLDETDAKLTALTELKGELEKAIPEDRRALTIEKVESALAFQEQVQRILEAHPTDPSPPTDGKAGTSPGKPLIGEAAMPPRERQNRDAVARIHDAVATDSELRRELRARLGTDIRPGKEAATVRDLVANAQSYAESANSGTDAKSMVKENANLRGQVAYLNKRLDARGGRDYPPCWVNEQGGIEYLFTIELSSDAFNVTPAWPQRREADARELPGLAQMLSDKPHSTSEFVERVRSVFDWSKHKDPECRHYVHLRSQIADAVQSDRARLLVEGFFYKDEARR